MVLPDLPQKITKVRKAKPVGSRRVFHVEEIAAATREKTSSEKKNTENRRPILIGSVSYTTDISNGKNVFHAKKSTPSNVMQINVTVVFRFLRNRSRWN